MKLRALVEEVGASEVIRRPCWSEGFYIKAFDIGGKFIILTYQGNEIVNGIRFTLDDFDADDWEVVPEPGPAAPPDAEYKFRDPVKVHIDGEWVPGVYLHLYEHNYLGRHVVATVDSCSYSVRCLGADDIRPAQAEPSPEVEDACPQCKGLRAKVEQLRLRGLDSQQREFKALDALAAHKLSEEIEATKPDHLESEFARAKKFVAKVMQREVDEMRDKATTAYQEKLQDMADKAFADANERCHQAKEYFSCVFCGGPATLQYGVGKHDPAKYCEACLEDITRAKRNESMPQTAEKLREKAKNLPASLRPFITKHDFNHTLECSECGTKEKIKGRGLANDVTPRDWINGEVAKLGWGVDWKANAAVSTPYLCPTHEGIRLGRILQRAAEALRASKEGMTPESASQHLGALVDEIQDMVAAQANESAATQD